MDARGKEILVPVDFTMAAKYGIDTAVRLANRLHTKIHLVNFIPPPDDKIKENIHVEDVLSSSINLLKENQGKLTELVHAVGSLNNNVFSEIKIDRFASGIKKQLKNKNIGLIVMGLNGHLSIGDTLCQNKRANDIIRLGCPVMVCNEHVDALIEAESILVSMDEDSYLNDNFDKFVSLTKNIFSKWHFIHVNHRNDKKLWNRDDLKNFIDKHEMSSASYEVVDSDDKEATIIEYAEKTNAECVAVNRHGKTSSFKDCQVEKLVGEIRFPVFIY
ncbi:universal stress protein [Fulvivirga sediminis]|uniref:Universal stress protein n=1 Tax=Fulvivirga sediminis TaxID=2803949 RepID=A0A937F7K3_9BACT|nr:universal stress protein [Fulvivirga sediminis]MBL3655744.1 universal stress protein [Fulvivirga sediminis]